MDGARDSAHSTRLADDPLIATTVATAEPTRDGGEGPGGRHAWWELRGFPVDLRTRYVQDGHWTDDTCASYLERHTAAMPG
jgi:hypothetical protein